jgi:cytochrome c-type biogenesis protein CcmH
MRHLLLGLTGWLLAISAWATVDLHTFDTESQRQRYLALVDELRCPKCQNQNLSGSDAEIATDLRRELHRLLLEGKTDQEIITFMVSRYGDFILYRPRLQENTWLLWFTPALLLVLGVIILSKIVHQRQSLASEPLTQTEEIKLQQLFADNEGSYNNENKDGATKK